MRAWFYRTLGLCLTIGVLTLGVYTFVRDRVKRRHRGI